MKKSPYLDNLLNWIYLHRRPVAFTLTAIMVLSIILDVSILQRNGALQTAKAHQAFVEESEEIAEMEAHAADISAHMDVFANAIEQGDYSLALDAINYIIENDTEDDTSTADYYLKRGGTYVLMEEYDKAMNDLDLSLRLNANQADIYTLKGQIYMLKENYEEALHSFELAILLSKQSPEVYYNKAVCHVMIGDYENAIPDLEYVLQSDCDEELKSDSQLLIDTISNGEFEIL